MPLILDNICGVSRVDRWYGAAFLSWESFDGTVTLDVQNKTQMIFRVHQITMSCVIYRKKGLPSTTFSVES